LTGLVHRPRRCPTHRLSWRLADLGRALLALIGAVAGLLVASWVVPDFKVGTWADAIVAAFLILVIGGLLRPLLIWGAVRVGWVATVALGLFGQTLIIWLVLSGEDTSVEAAFWGSWIVAVVSTLFVWVATAGTDDTVVVPLLRRARRRPGQVPDPEVPGVLFVQADGVPYPVLEWGVRAGTLPTLSRWIRSGSHRMTEWRPRLPATTPASQLGILHGTIEGVPAFRWYDRAERRVYVANKTADAAAIEAKASDGRGLLADDGVSVSNLFTGDAATAYATMSAVSRSREDVRTRSAINRYTAAPTGMTRSVIRATSEIVRERFQRAGARRRDVRPRVERGWAFAFERAALLGPIRDLSTHLVGEALLEGRRSIYVDLVDYDAVAHHVGLMQPEALSALQGIDRVLGQLERLAAVAPRPYHLVVLSDHGQSQGEIFADRYGEDLGSLVTRLADTRVQRSDYNAEGPGTINALVADGTRSDSVVGRSMRRGADHLGDRLESEVGSDAGAAPTDSELMVFGSGNLGLVFVTGEESRLTAEELSRRYPALVDGLVAHPGVGFVVVESTAHGPVVLGRGGEHRLRSGEVVGADPLAAFGPDAAAFVLRVAEMPEAPDILVNSLLDDLGEVAAFEGLVGCHGGLGGWQDRAMLVWPTDLTLPDGMIVGADALHRQLVTWLEALGHRKELSETSLGPGERG
jgi:hypothetical protein